MTQEEKDKLLKEIYNGLEEASEQATLAIMNMLFDLLIKLEQIPNPQHRIVFIEELRKEMINTSNEGKNSN